MSCSHPRRRFQLGMLRDATVCKYIQRNWDWLGPKIRDKLHIYTGDMDTYYLDVGVVLLQNWMQGTQDPHYPGYFVIGDRQPHCWRGAVTQAERMREIASFILRQKPTAVTMPWWKY